MDHAQIFFEVPKIMDRLKSIAKLGVQATIHPFGVEAILPGIYVIAFFPLGISAGVHSHLNDFFSKIQVPGTNPRAEKGGADAFLFKEKPKKFDAPGRQHILHFVGNAVMLEFNRKEMVVAVVNRITPISVAKFVHLHAG
ncbi:MAG: hypothetical protein ACOC3W_09530 [Thermodesulfobacteriota bacterium]